MRIDVLLAENSGIVWARDHNSASWATTAYVYQLKWTTHPASPIIAWLRLGSQLAARLRSLTVLAQAVDGLMEAAIGADLMDEWHKDVDICRENLRP